MGDAERESAPGQPPGKNVTAQVSRDTGLWRWIDARLRLSAFWQRHFSAYQVPRNLNFWYLFGALAMLVLVIQFVSGFFLTMHYKPVASMAFASVEHIMRDVRWGWLLRYVHTTGASLFFVVLYCHLFRGLIYGSYQRPRELVWLVGCFSFLCIMAEAFFGYLLPWGQMSYWGAQVILRMLDAIPLFGPHLATWVRGDYGVSDVTLNRFFAFHVIGVPLFLVVIVLLHLTTLRQVGSGNPDGIDTPVITSGDVGEAGHAGEPLPGASATLPFHPWFVVKDVFAAAVFLTIFAAIVFWAPTMGGYFIEPVNAVPANPLVTPADITPVWYFMPFYAILRACTDPFRYVLCALALVWGIEGIRAGVVPVKRSMRRRGIRAVLALLLAGAFLIAEAKVCGVVLMFSAVGIWFFLPWLDRSPVRSIRYRPVGQVWLYGLLTLAFLALGLMGSMPANNVTTLLAQISTLVYFGFFLGMPWWSTRGRQRPLHGSRPS